MKKVLIAIFAVIVTAMWVVPAMAVDATFDGQYRVRTIYTNNVVDNDSSTVDESSWIDQRFRLGIKMTEAPVMGYVQLQMGGSGANSSKVWGIDASTSAIQVRQAYLDFPVGPVGIRLGRTYASHGFLAGGMFENIADRYIFTYKVSDVLTTSFIHAKARDAKTAGPAAGANDNDRNIYNLGANYKMGDMGDAAARVYYVTDGLNYLSQAGVSTAGGDMSAWWATAQANLKFDAIKVYVSGAYLTGTSNRAAVGATTSASYNLTGYALHGDVSASFGSGQAKVGVVAGMGSGDDNTTDDTLNTFFAPGGASYIQSVLFFQSGENNYSIGSIGGGLNLQNGSRETLSNVTWGGIYGDFKASDDLSLSAKYAIFQQTAESSTVNAATNSKDIGNELDLIASYKLHKGLSLLAAAAYFTPGDAYTGKDVTTAAKSDTISAYYARLQWDF
ncbi:MAG: alginate export family protein [Deltaproteobacteria bacterium]|nr:alginate export family protein [Deltaproteobacteria bacterium]